MAYETLRLRFTGIAPLLMHRGLLADPLDEFSRAIAKISGKRKKVEADYKEMARLEFMGSLYVADGAPCVPADCIDATLMMAARRHKKGAQLRPALIVEKYARLEYDGPTDPDALWADDRFWLRVPARVGQARVMRTRPRFERWAATTEVEFMASLFDRDDLIEIAHVAGETCGLGDWRPRFGRFTVEVIG